MKPDPVTKAFIDLYGGDRVDTPPDPRAAIVERYMFQRGLQSNMPVLDPPGPVPQEIDEHYEGEPYPNLEDALRMGAYEQENFPANQELADPLSRQQEFDRLQPTAPLTKRNTDEEIFDSLQRQLEKRKP